MKDAALPHKTAKIVHFLYEPGDGGLDRVAVLLANEMAEMGHDCELWMARTQGPVAHLISDKVRVRIIAAPRFSGRGLHLVMQIPALARQIARAQPAVMFSAGNQSNLTLALARSMARLFFGHKTTAIIQKITNPVERPLMGSLRRFVRRWRFGLTARLADIVLMLSQADARAMAASYPGIATRFVPVRNAYVTPAMLEAGAGRTPRPASGAPRLLAVGRLATQKDYATMIRALGRIAHCPWTLTILGDGPLLQSVQNLARELGIAERISFEGFVPDPTAYYAQADILVLSSHWEGFPAVALEAMAAGCDVVATDCSPGLTELLVRSGSQAVPIKNPEALASAIEFAIGLEGREMALREQVEEYSIAASARDHLRIARPYLDSLSTS